MEWVISLLIVGRKIVEKRRDSAGNRSSWAENADTVFLIVENPRGCNCQCLEITILPSLRKFSKNDFFYNCTNVCGRRFASNVLLLKTFPDSDDKTSKNFVWICELKPTFLIFKAGSGTTASILATIRGDSIFYGDERTPSGVRIGLSTSSGFGLSSFGRPRSCVSQLRFRNEQCWIFDPFGRVGGMVNVRFSFGRFKSVYFILHNIGGYFFGPLKLLMKVPRAGLSSMNKKSIPSFLSYV